ncbi:hemoglobin-2-like isoform X2 [Scyliorhinus canicula]|uniref:hemoglobin-2-like isoform X2 n=1 Tax=Scyliorhinus canicula TaxID=7830 RepID=UPI0018F414AF|nr:hemoglobin-2-like isoform X2 [Scyliorhinus canicula]
MGASSMGNHGDKRREDGLPPPAISARPRSWQAGESGPGYLSLGCSDRSRLFETHPECKDVFFLFRDIDDLQQLRLSKELQSHGLRVMSFIEKSVARLEQEDKLEQLAFELGRSHCRYNAPPKYYEYVGVQFIAVVKPILKENWTPEVEEAWKVGRSSARQGPSVPFDW